MIAGGLVALGCAGDSVVVDVGIDSVVAAVYAGM